MNTLHGFYRVILLGGGALALACAASTPSQPPADARAESGDPAAGESTERASLARQAPPLSAEGAEARASGAADPDRCPLPRHLLCPALDGNRRVNSLSDGERGVFCDCLAAALGGYGKQSDCRCASGEKYPSLPSREACVRQVLGGPGCTATLAEHVGCYNLMRDKFCDRKLLKSAIAAPTCRGAREVACQPSR